MIEIELYFMKDGGVLKVDDIYYWFGAEFGSRSNYEFYDSKVLFAVSKTTPE